MENIEKQKHKLEEERVRIMDILVRKHVQSIENKGLEQCENIDSVHCMGNLENRYKQLLRQIHDLQKYENGLKNAKVQRSSGSNEMKNYYSKLELCIKSHYQSNCESNELPFFNKCDEETNLPQFSEEGECRKYLDLRGCYREYMNLKGIERTDYITYVLTFDHLFDFPRERKNSQYIRYLNTITTYLKDYLMRIQSLQNVNYEIEKAEDEFEVQWKNGVFPGWPRQVKIDANSESSVLSSWKELKSTLNDLELACNESEEHTDQRFIDNIKGNTSLHSYPLTEYKTFEVIDDHKNIAKLEAIIYRMMDLISVQRIATIQKVQCVKIESNS